MLYHFFLLFFLFVNPRLFFSQFVFHLFRRESQKKRRESLVQRRKRKARLSISFLLFDFIPASFLVSYKLSTLIRGCRLLFDA